MDAPRFDHLARAFAANVSRRDTLKAAVAGLLAVLGVRNGVGAQVSQAQCGNMTCAKDPGVCNDGCVCCLYRDSRGRVSNSRCRPPGACGPGEAVCPPDRPILDPIDGCIPEDGPCPPFQSRVAGVCLDPCTVDTCSGSCGSCAATPEGVALCFGPVSVQCFAECASNADCQDPLRPDCLITGLCEAGKSFCTKVTCTEP